MENLFAIRIKLEREKLGLKQIDIYKSLKIHKATYSAYERGEREPDFDTALLIAEFFDVSVDYLLGKVDTPDGKVKPEPNYKFMERLKQIRESKRIMKFQLAKEIGLNAANIDLYETGKSNPDIIILMKIAAFFDVSTDYLLGMVDDPHEQKTKFTPSEDLQPELEELKQYVEYVGVFKEVDLRSFTPQQVKQLVEFAKSIKGIVE